MLSKHILFFTIGSFVGAFLCAQDAQVNAIAAQEQTSLPPVFNKSEVQQDKKLPENSLASLAKKRSLLEKCLLTAKGTSVGVVSLVCGLCTLCIAVQGRGLLFSPYILHKVGFVGGEVLLTLASMTAYEYSKETFNEII